MPMPPRSERMMPLRRVLGESALTARGDSTSRCGRLGRCRSSAPSSAVRAGEREGRMRGVDSRAVRFACVFATVAVVGAIASIGSSASAVPPERAASYVVVFQPDVTDVPHAAHDLAAAHGGTVGNVYEHALHGFSVTIPPAGAAGIAHNPHVAYV